MIRSKGSEADLEAWMDRAPRETDAVRAAVGLAFGADPSGDDVERARARVRAALEAEPPSFYIVARLGRSPVGPLCLAMTERGLARLEFCEREEEFLRRLRRQRHVEILHESERARPVVEQLRDYLAGRRRSLDVSVDLRGRTEFQRRVLEGARRIPPGRVTTYGELARQIGRPGAARAVGQALGSNPVPIVIPCHRVLGGDGSLHGYSGGAGVRTKAWLLELEGARLSSFAEPL